MAGNVRPTVAVIGQLSDQWERGVPCEEDARVRNVLLGADAADGDDVDEHVFGVAAAQLHEAGGAWGVGSECGKR